MLQHWQQLVEKYPQNDGIAMLQDALIWRAFGLIVVEDTPLQQNGGIQQALSPCIPFLLSQNEHR
jgi:hypothetical protein